MYISNLDRHYRASLSHPLLVTVAALGEISFRKISYGNFRVLKIKIKYRITNEWAKVFAQNFSVSKTLLGKFLIGK